MNSRKTNVIANDVLNKSPSDIYIYRRYIHILNQPVVYIVYERSLKAMRTIDRLSDYLSFHWICHVTVYTRYEIQSDG